MSKTVALTLLNRANNGADLLQILDTLVEDNTQEVAYAEPTVDVIEF